MEGILGEQNWTQSPRRKPKGTGEEQKRSRDVQSLSDFNQTMHSKQVRKETFEKNDAKKDLSKYAKYLTKQDKVAQYAMHISQTRHTRHLKRDEVSAQTAELRESITAKK